MGTEGWSLAAATDRLAEDLRVGSRTAMAEIFRIHLDTIYNYCYRRTGSWSAAEDLTSTVFLEVWKNRRRALALDGSMLPWLYGVATNVCRNHQRSQRRRTQAMTRLQLADVGPEHLADDIVNQLDADRRAGRALERLHQCPSPSKTSSSSSAGNN